MLKEHRYEDLSSFFDLFGSQIIGRKVIGFAVLESTNSFAKKIAKSNCEDGTVIIAKRQRSGRGRLGREWYSDSDKGIWMSIVLKPQLLLEEVQVLTLGVSVAVVYAIRKTTNIFAGVKWPNDIIINNKKVCGILTEMSTKADKISYIVIGIGINVDHEYKDFPDDIRNIATSINIELKQNFDKDTLTKQILIELEKIYCMLKNYQSDEIIKLYRNYSVILGKQISFVLNGVENSGSVVDIKNNGALIVKCTNGNEVELFS